MVNRQSPTYSNPSLSFRLIESSSGPSFSTPHAVSTRQADNAPITSTYIMDIAVSLVSYFQHTALRMMSNISNIESSYVSITDSRYSPEKSGIQGQSYKQHGGDSLHGLAHQAGILSSIITIVSQGALRRCLPCPCHAMPLPHQILLKHLIQ